MRGILIICYILAAFRLSGWAQPCDPDALGSIPGYFRPGLKGSIHNVTPANLAKERQVLAELHQMISSAYQPKGMSITYANAFGFNQYSGKNWAADPYYYGLYLLRYRCGTSKRNKLPYQPDVASSTQVYIHVNSIWSHFGSLTLYPAELPDDHHTGYFRLRSWPQQRDSVYYWSTREPRERDDQREYQLLVTRHNKLPFRALTKREYIPVKVAELYKSLREQEDILKNMLADGGYSSESIQQIRVQIQQKKTLIRDTEMLLQKLSDKERNEPAIISSGQSYHEFEGFKKEGSPSSDIVAVPDPSYYDRSLPRWVPQFFCLTFSYSTRDEVYSSNIARIEQAIDLGKLRKMLGNTGVPAKAMPPVKKPAGKPS